MRVRLKHERLAEALARSPVTLNRWAQKMGLRSGHLSQLANGQRPYPTARTREKLLEALGLDFDELFEVEEAAPEVQPVERIRQRFCEAGATQPRAREPRLRKETPMAGWWSDGVHAARSLLRRAGYALVAVLTLGVGIGANVALFTAVNSVLFKAYGHGEPERLFVAASFAEDSGRPGGFSLPNALDLRERVADAVDLTFWDWEPFSLAGGDRPRRVGGGQVTSNFARVLGVPLVAGRFFTEDEARDGLRVVVLGEGLWQSAFGGDPAMVGRQVLLDGEPTTVVGIAPRTLDGVEAAELWVPLPIGAQIPRDAVWLGGYGRLTDGTSFEVARERLDAVAHELEREYPRENEGRRYGLFDLREARVGPVRMMFLTLQGVVGVVLLIVCANVANLLLSRGAARRDEMRLRAALGASRAALARLVAFESLWLALAGLFVGWGIGVLASRQLLALVPPENVPEWIAPDPDLRVVLFAIGATLLAMALSTFGPVLQHTSSATNLAVAQRFTTGRVRRGLVVAEVALSCVLLFGAGLLVRSLVELTSRDPGFETNDAIVVGLDLLSLRRAPAAEREQAFLRYYRAFEELPGVEAVGAVDRLPFGTGTNFRGFTVERPLAESYDPSVLVSTVTAGYFRAIGLPLFEGRDFELEPPPEGPRRTAVVSRTFAASIWPGTSPIGMRFKFGRPEDEAPWYEITGVVGDALFTGLADPARPTVYVNDRATAMARASWVVRGRGGAPELVRQVREAVTEIDPNQPLWGVRSLEQHVEADAWQQRFFATVFWVFAAIAAGLAAIGLYGVLAYSVVQRRPEMGVRLALGATSRRVAGLVISDGMRLVWLGLAIGAPLCLLAGKVLAGALFGIEWFDPGIFLGVVALLCAVGLVAVALPARRAARLDPAQMLRVDG